MACFDPLGTRPQPVLVYVYFVCVTRMYISMEAMMVGTSFLYFLPRFSRQNLLVNLDFAYLVRLASQRASCLTPWVPALGLQMCVTVPSFYVGLGDSNSVSYPPHVPQSASLAHAVLALRLFTSLSGKSESPQISAPISPAAPFTPKISSHTPVPVS